MANIELENLAYEIAKSLTEYGQGVATKTNKVVKKVAKETVKELKSTSPSRTDKYAKGWTSTTEKDMASSVGITVHNKKHYRLTHLLENGHALANGGRSRKFPHIKPAEEKAITTLEKGIKEAIENATI